MRRLALRIRVSIAVGPMLVCLGPWSGCAKSGLERAPFTVVMLPDTQKYSASFPPTFRAQTEWVRQNVRKENIVFVTQVGDIVDGGDKDLKQWKVASEAMSILDGVVPWGVAPGNHDYDRGDTAPGTATTFVQYFGPQRFRHCSWYGGASPNGLDSYQFFTGGGVRFLVLHLELDAPDEAIAWAQDVLKRYPRSPAVVSTHIYLDCEKTGRQTRPWLPKHGNSGEELFNKLIRQNPQIVMVLCGHQGRPGECHQTSMNDRGGTVVELLADYQKRSNGGDGWMQLIRVDLGHHQVQVRTYSPTLNQYETDADSQFILPFEMPVALRGHLL